MSGNAVELLRQLGSGPHAGAPVSGGSPPGGSDAAAGIERRSFADLLRQAGAGEISSHIPVTVAGGLDLSLSDGQLGRLADAADRAEAAGVRTALVLMDGRALVLDVAARTVTGQADPTGAGVLNGIDGVVSVPDSGAAGAGGVSVVPVPGGAAALSNPSITRLLAGMEQERTGPPA